MHKHWIFKKHRLVKKIYSNLDGIAVVLCFACVVVTTNKLKIPTIITRERRSEIKTGHLSTTSPLTTPIIKLSCAQIIVGKVLALSLFPNATANISIFGSQLSHENHEGLKNCLLDYYFQNAIAKINSFGTLLGWE